MVYIIKEYRILKLSQSDPLKCIWTIMDFYLLLEPVIRVMIYMSKKSILMILNTHATKQYVSTNDN